MQFLATQYESFIYRSSTVCVWLFELQVDTSKLSAHFKNLCGIIERALHIIITLFLNDAMPQRTPYEGKEASSIM